jgi:hypothetical protein
LAFGVEVYDIVNKGFLAGIYIANKFFQACIGMEGLAAEFARFFLVSAVGKRKRYSGV